MNLPAAVGALRQALVETWNAREPYIDWPCERTERLVAEKYAKREWNAKR